MKFSIHKKVLMLVVGAGLATFLMVGVFAAIGRFIIQKDMAQTSVELGENSAIYTDKLLTAQLKYTLGELAEAGAQFMDRELVVTREDAKILAEAMTDIFSHPENYSPKTLPDPRTEAVKFGEPYRIYAPDILNNITPEIQNELALAANVKDLLAEILKTYDGYNATAFVGGEKGWFIGADILHGEDNHTDFNATVPLSHERIYNFDTRKRPWYIKAKNANAPVISDLYRTVNASGKNSYQQIGASVPFYDAAGNMIGVVGLDSSNEDLYNEINSLTKNNGSINFVLNEHGEVIFSTVTDGAFAVNISDDLATRSGARDLRNSSNHSVAAAASEMVAGKQEVMPVFLNGEGFYLAFAPIPSVGWSFGMIISKEEVLGNMQDVQNYFQRQVSNLQAQMQKEYSYLNQVAVIIPALTLIILFFMSTRLSRRFVKPIHELSEGVREISSGNLDKKIEIHTGDEIEHLAICFNAMTDELKTYMKNLEKETAEKERIATELDVATEIQRGMLPKDFPQREDFELLATMTPAKEVGGDFYDYYFLDETHLAITVADVSGKGIPAALFMVISKTVLKNFAVSMVNREGLAEVVAAANDKLCANNEAMMFVTAFIGVLDLETGEFIFVNAGHNPPVIYHAEENRCDFLDVKKNFVMGPMDGISFAEQKTTFKHGDLIFIYTDGVTEALNVDNEEYLPDRLIAFMNSTDCKADLETLLKNVRGDLSKHVGEAEQSDDITMFALRFKGGNKA